MKRKYETPVIEKIAFVSDEKVCGLFGELFGIDVASTGTTFTKDSIFEWEQFDNQ